MIAASLFLLLLGLYSPWLANKCSFYRNDSVLFDHPMLTFIGSNLKSGHWPLWNPYLFCGVPQVALFHPELFYPPCWLFALLPYSQALAVVLLFDQFIAGFGTFLLISELGWGLVAAAMAGLTMGLAGYFFSVSALFALHSNAAWLPLCLWSMLKLARVSTEHHSTLIPNSRQALWITVTAILICLLMLAGALEIAGPGLLLAEGILIRRLWNDKWSCWSTFIAGNLAIGLGMLLAMPAILPAAEWTLLSTRSIGLNAQEVFYWSTNWYDLLGMAAMQPLGDLSRVDSIFQPIVATCPVGIPFIASLYISPIVITLAAWGMAAPFRGRWLLVALLAMAIVLSMGSYTPVAPFLVKLLHFTTFRYPIKLMFFALFFLAVLAAAGLRNSVVAPLTVRRANGVMALVWISMAGIGLWCAVNPEAGASSPLLHHDVSQITAVLAAENLGRGVIMSAAAGLIACLLGELLVTQRIGVGVFNATALIAQGILLVASACAFAGWAGPPDFYSTKLPLQETLSRMTGPVHGITRVAFVHADMIPSAQFTYSSDATTNFFQFRRQTMFFATNMDSGMGSMILFIPMQTKDCEYLCWQVLEQHSRGNDSALARYCQMTGAPFAVTAQSIVGTHGQAVRSEPLLDPRYFTQVKQDPALNLRIYRVRDVLPRVYLADNVKWGSPHQACLDFVSHPSATGFDPRALTLLEHPAGELGPTIDKGAGDSSVVISRDANEVTELDVKSSHNQFLVLSDQYYPGWSASVDGKPVEIYRANILSRAVFVPAGDHKIRFVYDPQSLQLGLLLCGLAGAAIVGLLVFAFRQR